LDDKIHFDNELIDSTIDEIVQAYDDPHLTREAIQEAMSMF
jgi:hypothetical protein